jgi:2-polyprenyl-3-methyl-5-hydroxy-6-metoxy-1,4-benzoquinol methylase
MRNHNYRTVLIKSFFDREYGGGNLDVTVWRMIEAKLLDQALRRTGVTPESNILDVGCGDGFFTNMIFDREKVVGVDMIESDIAHARRYSIFRDLHCLDITKKTVLPADHFDFVYSNCVLEHVNNIDAGLKEISRTMKPGGWFFISVPSPCFAQSTYRNIPLKLIAPARARKISENINRRFSHINLFPPSEWQRRMSAAGFGKFEMMKYYTHREFLHYWEFYKQYLICRPLRILSPVLGSAIPAKLIDLHMKSLYGRYDLSALGTVSDECTHNGLVILCRKL